MTPPLPYFMGEPPARLKKARLDNIALVPASLLSSKDTTYQPLANRLPKGSVLCVEAASPRQKKILASVVSFLRNHGHIVITLPIERLTRRTPNTRTGNRAQTQRLRFKSEEMVDVAHLYICQNDQNQNDQEQENGEDEEQREKSR
jgi:hypothetical protein